MSELCEKTPTLAPGQINSRTQIAGFTLQQHFPTVRTKA